MPDHRKGHNLSGAADPTATAAEDHINKEERRVSEMVACIKSMAGLAGFYIEGRITLVDKKSGREWR